MIYIFKTKFAKDKQRNGERCIIIEDLKNGMFIIQFLKDGSTLKVYDNEIMEA